MSPDILPARIERLHKSGALIRRISPGHGTAAGNIMGSHYDWEFGPIHGDASVREVVRKERDEVVEEIRRFSRPGLRAIIGECGDVLFDAFEAGAFQPAREVDRDKLPAFGQLGHHCSQQQNEPDPRSWLIEEAVRKVIQDRPELFGVVTVIVIHASSPIAVQADDCTDGRASA